MISHFSEQKEPGVFHAKNWNSKISLEVISELFNIAKANNNKARLCLHPSVDETAQVTYLAFVKPYRDKIHSHPLRSEVMIPIIGEAEHRIYDEKGNLQSKSILSEHLKSAISIEKNILHSLELISSRLLILEIGSGPFISGSTKYFQS